MEHYTIERLSSQNQLQALKEPWDALTARIPQCSFFLSWDWISSWWENFNDGNDLWLLTAKEQNGNLVGIAPLMCRPLTLGPLTLGRLCFIGSGVAGPIHLDIIVEEDVREELSAAFLAYLNTHDKEWDILDLKEFRDDSPLRQQLLEEVGRCLERDPEPCSIVSLPTSWATFQSEHMNRKLRKTIRYYTNKLKKDYPGQVDFEWINSEAELNRSLDFLMTNSRRLFSDGQVASCFENEAYCEFYKAMAHTALRQGTLRFYQLKVDKRIIAVQHCFIYQGTYYGYQTTYDPDWQQYSPGQQLLAHVFQEAISEKAKEVNMSHGENEYKTKWANDVRIDRQLLYVRNKLARLYLCGVQSFDGLLAGSRRVLPLKVRLQLGALFFIVRRLLDDFPDWF